MDYLLNKKYKASLLKVNFFAIYKKKNIIFIIKRNTTIYQ